jgi:2,4-dienoyl-CoA reductase-like NADH-dependent reductase (Old Yellow Enzyme family)
MNQVFKETIFKNNIKIKNKMVLAPMTTYSSNDDLTLSDEEEIYYNARAKEFGIVITAATAVNKDAQAFENQISIRDSRYLDSMKRLAHSIKKENSLAILQLHHGGRMNVPNLYPNQDIVSASAVKANRDYAVTPRELKTSEVYDIIDDFRNATKLAIKAGFDGIELHGANTYLIQQFFSPHSNQREDEFGGSLEKRLTFPMTLVDCAIDIRNKYADNNFIIGYRLSPEELEEPGITLEDTLLLVEELSFKDIDYIHLSMGRYDQTSQRDKSDLEPIITKVKDRIEDRVSLIGVGKISSIDNIEKAQELGFDYFAMGLPALVDAKVISHLRENLPLKKVIDEDSYLPKNLKNRLHKWIQHSSEYSFKD